MGSHQLIVLVALILPSLFAVFFSVSHGELDRRVGRYAVSGIFSICAIVTLLCLSVEGWFDGELLIEFGSPGLLASAFDIGFVVNRATVWWLFGNSFMQLLICESFFRYRVFEDMGRGKFLLLLMGIFVAGNLAILSNDSIAGILFLEIVLIFSNFYEMFFRAKWNLDQSIESFWINRLSMILILSLLSIGFITGTLPVDRGFLVALTFYLVASVCFRASCNRWMELPILMPVVFCAAAISWKEAAAVGIDEQSVWVLEAIFCIGLVFAVRALFAKSMVRLVFFYFIAVSLDLLGLSFRMDSTEIGLFVVQVMATLGGVLLIGGNLGYGKKDRDSFNRKLSVAAIVIGHFVIIGYPGSIGFENTLRLFEKSHFLTAILVFKMLLLSSAILRIVILDRSRLLVNERYVTWGPAYSLALMVLLLGCNEFTLMGTWLGQSLNSSSWVGLLKISSMSDAYVQLPYVIGGFLGAVGLACLISYLINRRVFFSTGETNPAERYMVVSFANWFDKNVIKLIAGMGRSIQYFVVQQIRAVLGGLLIFNRKAESEFLDSRLWNEGGGSIVALSYFIRFMQTGNVKIYLLFSLVFMMAFMLVLAL